MAHRLDASHSVLRVTRVPDGWRVACVGELADIVGGGTPDRQQNEFWRDGTVPWITPTDLTSNGQKYISDGAERISELGLKHSNAMLAPTKSIVFSTRGTVGNLALSAVPLTCNQSCEILIPRTETVDSEFLFYLLEYGYRAFVRLSGGTTFGAITRRDIARVKFAVPPSVDEQAAIARILDAVDSTLERTRDTAERARYVFTSVVAELLGRGIGHDGNLRDPIENARDFVVTPLGRLPRDWRISTVGDEFEVQSGFTINSDRQPRLQKRRYLRVANVQRDFIDLSDVHELEAKEDEFSRRVLAPDDLVIVEGHADSMEIGRCARVTAEAAGMTFQNHLFRLRTKGEIKAGFACMWLNSIYARRFWNARCATSSGLNTINQRALKQLVVPVPSEREQRAIVSIGDQCRRFRDSVALKRHNLEALKSSLMHDLLTGRVRVGDIAGVRTS